MDIIITILRSCAFLLSVLGYIMLVRIKWHIPSKFSYIFVFSAIACVIFFAGLLNVLIYAAYFIFAAGIGLFIFLNIQKKLSAVFNLKALNILNLAFCFALGIIFSSLINTMYIHYDNFSHWGIVVKDMLSFNAFPNASSAIIDFKTYPLGSSSFLYYICKIVGSSEGVMLVGQALLIFACFYAMFGVIQDTKRLLLTSMLALCFAGMTFFNISIRINNLLVDFLLPILGLAALAAMFACRHDLKKACITSAPLLALLVIVKNSGIFFAAICYVYLIFLALRTKKYHLGTQRRIMLLFTVLTIAVSFVTLMVWNLHTSIAFKGQLPKFTISAENFNTVYSAKTTGLVSTIIHNFLSSVFNLSSLATVGIVLFNAVALLAYLIARIAFKKKWNLLKVLICLDVAVILYYVGILAMFLFTMPTDEALILAGFERYASSIVIFLIGGLALCAANDTENSLYVQQGEKRNHMAFKSLFTKSVYQYATIVFIASAVILLLSEINGMNSMKTAYPSSLPAKVESVVGNNWSGIDSKKYLFYSSDKDKQISNYYLQYIGRYLLFAPNVDAIDTIDNATFMQKLKDYDYLVIIEPGKAIDDFMRHHTNTDGKIGIYPIDKTFH